MTKYYMEFVLLGLNVSEGCYYIKVIYTKLKHLNMKQCEDGFYINHDGRDMMELLYPIHLLPKIDMKRNNI